MLIFPEVDDNSDDGRGNTSSSSEDPSGSDQDVPDETVFTVHSSVKELQRTLLQGYSPPSSAPSLPFHIEPLTRSQSLTLEHYIAWVTSNGTVLAYKKHAQVLQRATGVEILSLHSARKLAATLTNLKPTQVDVCPQSCIAYTGEFSEMESCPYVRDGKACGQPCFQKKKTPAA
jgi:hypothetical protein